VIKKPIRDVIGCLALCFAVLCIIASPARAVSFGFVNITNNNATDAATGEAQLSVDVADYGVNSQGNNLVLFTFTNSGPNPSSITEVYFDDGVLLNLATVQNISGVDFTQDSINPTNPPDLPGGKAIVPQFNVTASFSADVTQNTADGVNPGDILGIVFELQDTKTYSDVIADLNSRALRIGIHVRDFAGGGSESFITPIPGAVLLGMLGMGVAGLKLRKKA
jgi:hypothetical protein